MPPTPNDPAQQPGPRSDDEPRKAIMRPRSAAAPGSACFCSVRAAGLSDNDPSSATAATRRADCNCDGPPPFASAHGLAAEQYQQCHRDLRHFLPFRSILRTKLLTRRAMGPAMPIPTALLPVASNRAYPIPAPALIAKIAAIAAERVDCLSFGCCSILFMLCDA